MCHGTYLQIIYGCIESTIMSKANNNNNDESFVRHNLHDKGLSSIS